MRVNRSAVSLSMFQFLCLLAVAATRSWAQQGPAELSTEKEKAIVEAARQYAKAVAGDDETSPAYYRMFQYAIDGAKKYHHTRLLPPARRTIITSTPAEARPSSQGREARTVPVSAATVPPRSIFTDPTWLKNEQKRVAEALKDDPGRIFGGKPAKPGELPDCVGVQGVDCVCTGTLIGPNVVITAGHCDDGGCVDKIYIGNDLNEGGRTVKVKQSIRHPGFNRNTLTDDLTVLILDESVTDVTPRPIAQGAEVDDAFALQLAGFGLTESGSLGRKLVVEVSIATPNCGADVSGGFGCHVNKEIVAGGNGHDSCNGDSGGPAYVKTASGLKLAAATSRASANATHNCGDGGIYVRLDRYLDWIRQTARDNGGTIP
jgi:Trypsin